ncbi:MAG TPA: universal stress protein [Methanomassiliicoccales archaeon]
MTTLKRILVGVDGSENSLRAAKMAAEIATPFSSEIVLLYVLQPTESAYYTGMPTTDEAERAKGEEKLYRAKTVCEEAGAKTQLKVMLGNPAEVILNLSEDGFDLVIVGTRGIGALARFLMGSVSSRVVQYSKVPVMVVP